jgi:hypothetical protein
VDSDSNLQLRFRVQETNTGTGAATDNWKLQYSKNGGAYTDVTTASTNVKGFNSANLTEGQSITAPRLTGGTGTFVNGKVAEDGEVNSSEITPSNFTEFLYSLTIIAADTANNDTLDFRLLYNNSSTYFTYSQTPRITVTKSVVEPTTDQCLRHCAWFSGGVKQPFFW